MFSFGALIIGIVNQLFGIYNVHKKDGQLWKAEYSNLIKQEADRTSVDWWCLLFLVINVSLNIGLQGAIIFCLQFAVKGNLGIGLITAIFSVTTLFTPILFLCFFKETLGKKAFLAILLVVGGIILGAIPHDSSKSDSSESSDV